MFGKLSRSLTCVTNATSISLCFSGECLWLHIELIRDMMLFCKELFPVVDYGYCTVPTYPSGQIGFILCSKNPVSNIVIN